MKVVLMEAGLVAPLAVACAESAACLGPEGASVADAIASLGWNDVASLTWASGPLATGLLLLGLVGGLLGSLRVWQTALLVLAAVGVLFTSPGLHAPAHWPLLFVLVVFGSLAVRWLTGRVAAAGPAPTGPAAHGIRQAPARTLPAKGEPTPR